MKVEEYKNERPFVLESTYGCYSDYGWAFAAGHDTLKDAQHGYCHWVSKGGKYRVVKAGAVIIGDIRNK